MGKGHFAVMDLSEDAQTIVHSGFLANRTLQEIAAAVQAATGETIAVSSLGNYRTWWRSEKRRMLEAREIVRDAVAAVKLLPPEHVGEAIDQKLETLALLLMEKLEGEDPKAVLRILQGQRRLRLDRGRLDQGEKRLAIEGAVAELERRKLELAERRIQAIEAKVREADLQVGALVEARKLTPEVAAQIRAIYELDHD